MLTFILLLMKKQILFLCSFFLVIHVFSQNTFFKFIHGWRSENIFEAENSYIIPTLNATFPFQNHINFAEVSLSGDSITNWIFEVDSSQTTEVKYSNSFTKKRNNHIYISSHIIGNESNEFYGVLSKFSSDLKTEIWSKSYILSNQSTALSLATFKNDTSLILGSYNKNNNNLYTTFLETDTSGVIRWQKDFNCFGDCNMKPFHILPTEDNGFIFTCFESRINGQPGLDDFQTAVIKTDSLGNTQWRHTWGGDTTKNVGSWVVPLDDGNFLFAWTDNYLTGYMGDANYYATIHFAKFDIDGNVIWYKDMSNDLPVSGNPNTAITGYYYTISQMELMPDGNIIIAGENLQITQGKERLKGLIIKIDQEAEIIWHRSLIPPDLNFEDNTASSQRLKILSATFTIDDGFILAGEYFSSPGNMFPEVYQSAFAYKLDEYGCYEPGCNVHDNIEEIEQPENIAFSIYPNPARNFLVIENSGLKIKTCEVYSMQGQLIEQHQIQNVKTEFSTETWKKGVYVVKVGTYIKKVIIK